MMLSPHSANKSQRIQDHHQQNLQHQQPFKQHQQNYLNHHHRHHHQQQLGYLPNPDAEVSLHSKAGRFLVTKDIGSGGRMPFNHNHMLTLGSTLSMQHDSSSTSDTKQPGHRLVNPSSVLNSADLQFSGYILNGNHDINRPYYPGQGFYPYPASVSIPMGQGDGDSSRLLDSIGMADPNALASPTMTPGISVASPAHSHPMGPAGMMPSSTPASSAPSSSVSHHGFSSVGSMPFIGYNSYASLLNKANLKFENNLDSMMIDWTLEERECRRRLVQFWRRHENNNIFCTFKAVAAVDRVPNSIVVSCIYWEEKQDFFITSVDCIYLLESLIAVRFTVEEKNRIRRNLEGFRPLTVSKCKAESAEFFKLIMSFPNPKPRNIEKDVKVFPWRILPLALKKIIGKYTASYSSTASVSLDAYPASRGVPSYSQFAGIPVASSAGGMTAFPPCSPSAGGLGSSSASAAIVAAAAAAAAAMAAGTTNNGNSSTGGSSGTSAASGSNQQLSASPPLSTSSASLAAMVEAQRRQSLARLDGSGIRASSLMQPTMGISMGMGLDLGMAMDGTAGSDTTCSTAAASTISAPTDVSSLLMLGDIHQSASRSAGVSYLGNAEPYEDKQQTPGYMLAQGCCGQLDLAGMAAVNPASFIDSSASTQPTASSSSLSSSSSSSSLLDQLTAGYSLSQTENSRCGSKDISSSASSKSQLGGNGQQQQHVVRSSHAKRAAQHTPYTVDRGDRRSTSSSSSRDDGGANTSAAPSGYTRVGTAFSCSGDESGGREPSPSIPLLQQQQQQQQQGNNPIDTKPNAEGGSSKSTALPLNQQSVVHVGGPVVPTEEQQQQSQVQSEQNYMPLCNLLTKAFHNSTKGGDIVLCNASSSSSASSDNGNGGNNVPETATNATPALVDAVGIGAGADVDMFKFSLGDGFTSGDFTFLADLIGVTGDPGGNVFADAPAKGDGDGGSVGEERASFGPEEGLGAGAKFGYTPGMLPSMPAQNVDIFKLIQAGALNKDPADAQGMLGTHTVTAAVAAAAAAAAATVAGSAPSRVGSPRVAGGEPMSPSSKLLAQMLSPSTTPPESVQPPPKPVLKFNPATSGVASSHILASPLVFNTSLFGEGKGPYLLDRSHGF